MKSSNAINCPQKSPINTLREAIPLDVSTDSTVNIIAETSKVVSSGLFRAYSVAGVLIPLEMFLKIFQYSATRDLLAARKTCSDWNKITDYVVRHKDFKSIYPPSPILFDRFISSIEEKHSAKAECLLYYGNVDIDQQSEHALFRDTPLHLAVRTINLDLVSKLLKKGAFVNSKDLFDMTPLMHAVRYSCVEIFDLLVSFGADLRQRSIISAGTLLHVAAECKQVSICSRLIELRFNTLAKDGYGQTPLHVAARSGSVEIVTILLAAGADTTIKDNHGQIALSGATYCEHSEVIALLK